MKSKLGSTPGGSLVSKLLDICFTLLLIASFAVPLMADPCQAPKNQVTQLNQQLQNEYQHLYLPYGKPGEPLKPVKDRVVAAEISVTEQKIAAAEQQVAKCEAPPPAPDAKVKGFTAENMGTPDPQIAVGHKYFAAIDTGAVGFYQKATQTPMTTGFVYPSNPVSASTLFGDFFLKIDKQMDLPSNVCDLSKPQSNYTDGNFDYSFDPAHPNKAIPGCIYAAYDTRVIYDETRRRFWIASAIRNALWPCSSGPGAQIGGFNKISETVLLDPDPNDPTNAKCHTDWKASWAHRFIGVAISQTNSAGEEDLTKPFLEYALVDDYNDWPQMTVNKDYLLLNHMDTGDSVEVFSAQALADGTDNNTSMKVKPLITMQYSDFRVTGGTPLPATNRIFLVNSHGPANGMTYMISSNGNNLLIFALKAPDGDPSGKPKFLNGAAVDLGHGLSGLRNNSVFRNGKLYIAGFECTDSESGGCIKYIGRIIRVPVRLSSDGKSVHATGPGSEGFLDYKVGTATSDRMSYENTMIEVTEDDDLVFAFEGVGLEPGHLTPASVNYSVFYHDKGNISDGGILKAHDGDQMPVPADPGQTGGIIDLGGIALDPSDNKTVWISHGYSNNGHYAQAAGAVKP